MPDNTIDSLRKAFMKENDNMPDDCQMADLVSSYAFGELDPKEAKKVKDHLTTCRYCLDLYMDIGMAEEEAQAGKDVRVEVLHRLQEASKKDKPQTVSPVRAFMA